MLRTTLLLFFALAAGTPMASADEDNDDSKRPNILFIMADDHAAHAIGAYGGRLSGLNPTPNIDRLAREGALLRNVFCVNSICTPSRATIITGQYSHEHGCLGFAEGIEAARQTLALEMKAAGFETAVFGKWHLIEEPAAFDNYAVMPGQGSYFNPVFRIRGDRPWPDSTVRVAGYDSVHSSDAITDLSLKWLRDRPGRGAKPFFLMHHFKAPHDNFENAERYDWLLGDAEIPEPSSLRERGGHGPIGEPQHGTSVSKRNQRRNMGHHMFVDQSLADDAYTTESYQRYLKKYLRCVKGVDDNVGRLLDSLEQSGELENTVIVYTADQGFMLGEHDYIDKRWMYEESLRMPFLIRYPARIAPGTVLDDIVNNVDFAPTLLDIAGAEEMPDSFRGRSFLPNLQGQTPDDWPQSTYYHYWLHMAHHDVPGHYGIRMSTHKLIFFYGLPLGVQGADPNPTSPYWELYDLSTDPHEMTNLYGDPAHADVVRDLKAELFRLKEEVGDTDDRHPELERIADQARQSP